MRVSALITVISPRRRVRLRVQVCLQVITPHVTGILKNADLWQHSWVEQLAESGYHCVNIGKMHTQPFETPLGFHERYVVENKDRYLEGRYYFDEWDKALRARGHIKQQRELYRLREDYRERMGAFEWELPEDLHSDMFVGEMAKWWINSYPQTEPLFLQIGFPGPHPPYDPIPRYAEPYMERDMPETNVTSEDIEGQPQFYKNMREHNFRIDHDSVVHLDDPSDEQIHRLRAYYNANVTMIDEKIGEIFTALDEQGYLENSVIIFTSDHGDCLGDHGHIQKWTMYDIITRVPMIVWSPERFAGGRRLNAQCQLMDIGRTILEFAQVEAPDTMQAESLLPALQEEDWSGREYVFAEHPPDGIYEGTFMTMVRSEEWKLVHFVDCDEGQLFNLKDDPDERHNLWESEPEQRQALLNVLLDWRTKSQYQTKDVFAQHR